MPAGIAPGRSLRLRGKGWPLKNGRGDLLLTVQLSLPQNPGESERQLYEQLRNLGGGELRQLMFQNSRL